ncbi:FtsQ-type POTRA domain-containing protein [Corynebacterium qintianiae]|uniref:FtsQ-type POTRA domain-containing protein n=1 Tax=Corynebacterium qintianiae TaxID=2709392 RepID=A0A7T0PE00_9CORY|nr:FtsQ-type POTRA domain-containing protein [Corynebacterium qintianiae]QPK82681.1 FtsQ-type POTRA domain-containing protein [Corynebacterium qintianiae]
MLRNKRRLAAGALLAVILLIVAALVLPRTQAVPVKSIAVEGAQQVTPEQIVSATGISLGMPMGAVNTHDAAVGVAGVPWVKTATVSRSWPSTIEVEITEHVAVAFVRDGEGSHLINSAGDVFAVDEPPAGAVEITGDAAREDGVLAAAVEVAASISEKGREAVRSLEARGPHIFVLHLTDDRTVVWGANEDNANKALALDVVLQREGGEFNVTNPEQVTVR